MFIAAFSLLVALALAPPASAGTKFIQTGSIDGSTTPAGSFGNLLSESVAVNGKNGHILIADSTSGLVYDYDSPSDASPGTWDGSTTPAGSFGGGRVAVAVDDTTGDVYVADSTHAVIDKFDQTGALIASFGDTSPSADGQLAGVVTPAGSFLPASTTSFGIAVDQATQNLFVIDAGHFVINVFDSTGAYQSQVTATPDGLYGCGSNFADGIAVNDKNSHLYVSDSCPVRAFEFDLAGNFLTAWDGSTTPAGSFGGGYVSVAAANASGNVYVSHDNVVDVFDETGAFKGQIAGLAGPRGVSIAQASGDVWVSDGSTVRSFVGVPIPDATTDAADNLGETTATVHGRVNPVGLAAEYQFEYGTDSSYGSLAPVSPASAGSGSSEVEVSEELSGLTPDTVYHYRLVATNANGVVQGLDRTFRTTSLPTLSGEQASDIGPSSARLTAAINPHHQATTYRFEYGPTTAYGTSLPAPAGSLPADADAHSVSVQPTGLQPSTQYHWRLVAENIAGDIAGVDHTFTTLAPPPPPGVSLPDNRAWERVTPVDKNGTDLRSTFASLTSLPGLSEDIRTPGVSVQSSESGERINFFTNTAAFANPGSSGTFQGDYISERSLGAWATQNIDPPYYPADLLSIPVYMMFDKSLSKALYLRPVDQAVLTPDALEGVDGYYIRHISDGSFHFMFGHGFSGAFRVNYGPYAAASDDFTHIVKYVGNTSGSFEGEPSGVYEAYETTGGAFHTRLVSILPDETEIDGDLGGGEEGPVEHSVSRDGSRIVFKDSHPLGGCVIGNGELPVPRFNSCLNSGPAPQIYIRENAASTRLISGYAPGVPVDAEAGRGQHFWGADPDVEHVFFTSQTKLTSDSTASHDSGDGVASGSFGDLYRYDVEANGGAGELEDITVDNADPEGAQVIGVLGNSEDGNRIYFVARSNKLDGEQGVAGDANLYLWDDNGGSSTTTYIATLQPLSGEGLSRVGDSSNWISNTYARTSEVTPDGSHIMFTSKNQLTAFTNAGHNEVYAYDAGSDRLQCASCGGDAPAVRDAFVPYSLAMKHFPASVHSHSLSSDGRWVFFNTRTPLVARDTNGAIDAYEFNTETGKVALLSSGRDADLSMFLGASLSGRDAFFITRSQLVGDDHDAITDIYDARVNGGIASQNPTPSAPCEGEACQPPSIAPDDATPSSSSFAGAGNQRAKKRHHKSRHHKRRHHKRQHRRHAPSTHRHG